MTFIDVDGPTPDRGFAPANFPYDFSPPAIMARADAHAAEILAAISAEVDRQRDSVPSDDRVAAALASLGGRVTAFALADAMGGRRADALLGIQRAIERRRIVEHGDGTLSLDGGAA